MKPINSSTTSPSKLDPKSPVDKPASETSHADWKFREVTQDSSTKNHMPSPERTARDSGIGSQDASLSSRTTSLEEGIEPLITHRSESLEVPVFWQERDGSPLNIDAKIGATLGHGATAIVDLVEQGGIDGNTERFALKIPIKGDLQREAEIMLKVGDHPNIVQCFGIQEVEGRSGLLFNCVDGQNLETLTVTLMHQLNTGLITPAEFFNAYAHLQEQQLSALAHLEETGIVHSDVKPLNSMYDKNTQSVKQLDFGQSAMKGERAHFGSEDYADPETFELLKKKDAYIPATAAIDAFAYGQTLYRTLKELETGTAASFCHDANLSGFSASERDGRALKLYEAMQRYSTPKSDNSYHQAIPDDEESLHQISLRIASVTNNDIQNFDTLYQSAEIIKPYIKSMTALINSLLHPSQKLRALPSQAVKYEWFKECITDPDQARKTLNLAIENRA